MAVPTNNAAARAARRSAARNAAAQTVEAPAQVAADDAASPAEAEVMDAEIEEAFGPADVPPQKPQERLNQGTPVSQASAAASALVGADKIRGGAVGGGLALPQIDLTRKIDASDVIIPKLRQSQAMSKTNTLYATSRGKDGVGMGNWYITTQNKNLGETVFFVPVDMRKSRAYFVQGQGLMCRSFDLLNGEGDPGGSCEGSMEEQLTVPASNRGCPLRLWNDSTPPKCGQTYNYPGFMLEADEEGKPDVSKITQVILQLRSASTKAAKAINTYVMNEGEGVWQNVVLELGTESQTNTKGTFFVPTVDFYDTTDAPEFARLKRRADSMARQMGSATLRSSLEDDAE